MAIVPVTDEKYLLQRLREGDERAFNQLYNQYWDKLYVVAHRNLRSAEAAEEVVQEVFLKLWKKRDSLVIQSLPVYLAAMVRYAVYHYLAKEKQGRERDEVWLSAQDNRVHMEETIENKLLLEIITELSNQLPEKCRLVFQYNKLQDKPLNQVAEELHISQKTAEAHLTKALKVIRSKFGDGLHSFFL